MSSRITKQDQRVESRIVPVKKQFQIVRSIKKKNNKKKPKTLCLQDSHSLINAGVLFWQNNDVKLIVYTAGNLTARGSDVGEEETHQGV